MEGFRDSPPDFNGRKSQITPGAAHVTGPNGSPLTTILTAGGGIGILVLSGVINTEHDRCMTVSVRHSRAANGPVDCDRGCKQSNGTRAACCTPRNTSPRVFPCSLSISMKFCISGCILLRTSSCSCWSLVIDSAILRSRTDYVLSCRM